MRPIFRLPVLRLATIAMAATFATGSLAAAQDRHDPDPRIVVHAQVRDAIRERIVNVKEAPRGYQGRNSGPEQTERFSRKMRLERDGRLSISNIAGDIVVTTGSGDEVSIEAIKRTRGDRNELAGVQILVDERAGRIDVRTDHNQNGRRERGGDHVSVDYTVVVPATAALDLHSISGNLKVSGARGALRAETISGDVTATDTPKVELAKSVSGDVTLTGVSTDGDLAASSISGTVHARSIKVHALDLNSISGSLAVTDVTCDRLNAKSVSGDVEYSGAITRGGTYDFNVHAGTIRLNLTNPAGFVLNANSFSGSIRSDLPMTLGGNADRDGRSRRGMMSNKSIRGTFGDGSATLTVRTFSGDIVISKR